MNPNKNEDEKLAGFKPTNTAGGDFENKVDNSLKPSVGINSSNPDRRELALKESWGHSSLINNNAANFASESNLYKKDSGDNSKTGKIKSLTSGSVKKKITMAFAGIFGSGAIGLIVMVIIMLSTGFGIKQVAIVIRNFEFYKIYRMSGLQSARIIEAKAERAKISAGDPDGVAKDLESLDVDKVTKTVNGNNIEVSESAQGSRVKVGDGAEIDTSTTEGRLALEDKLLDSDALRTKSNTFENPVADKRLNSVGVEKTGWSDELKDSTAGKEQLETDAKANTESYEKIRGDPKTTEAFSSEARAAQEAITNPETGVKGNISKIGEGSAIPPLGNGVAASTQYLESGLAKLNELLSALGGLPFMALMAECTAHQVTESYSIQAENGQYQASRQAAKLQSMNDQIESGNTTSALVGSGVKRLGNINKSGSYQMAAHNKDYSDPEQFDQISPVDYPIPPSNNVINALLVIDSAVKEVPGHEVIFDVCKSLANPYAALAIGGLSVFVNILSHFVGVGEVADSVEVVVEGGAKGTASDIGETIAINSAEDGAKKGLLVSIKEGFATVKGALNKILNPLDGIAESAGKYARNTEHAFLPRLIAASADAGIKVGGSYGKAWAAGYFATKIATMNTGNIYNGTENGQFIDQAAAGHDLVQSDQQRVQMYGRQLSPKEVAVSDKQQQVAFYQDQRTKSLFTRMLDIKNPYSIASKAMVEPSIATETLRRSPISLVSLLRESIGKQMARANPFVNGSVFSQFASAATTNNQYVYASNVGSTVNHFGVVQYGYSEDEVLKIREQGGKDGEYSVKKLTEWATLNKELVSSSDTKYGVCYNPETPYLDTVNSPFAKNNHPECWDSWLKSDIALHWRVYKSYKKRLVALTDLMEVTGDQAEDKPSPTSDQLPSGASKDLAQQILNNPKITFTTSLAKEAIQDAANGLPSKIESRCNAGSSAPLDPVMLAIIIKIAETHTIGVGYLTNGCHTGNSRHYVGKAVDINQIDGQRVTGGSPDRPFMHELTGILPSGTELGQVNCSSIPINPINSGVGLVTDTCNHIHVGVPR